MSSGAVDVVLGTLVGPQLGTVEVTPTVRDTRPRSKTVHVDILAERAMNFDRAWIAYSVAGHGKDGPGDPDPARSVGVGKQNVLLRPFPFALHQTLWLAFHRFTSYCRLIIASLHKATLT